MHYFVGVDGGGSRTRVLIASDDGLICGLGLSGPSNPNYSGIEGFTGSFHAALASAWNHCGCPRQPVQSCFLGIAGGGSLELQKKIRATVTTEKEFSLAAIQVDHDIRIALAGGLEGTPGIAVIAGTGSSGYGRTQQGQTWQAGGWGALLDDVGGGYWLALRGITAALKAYDGRSAVTSLQPTLFENLGASTPSEVLQQLRNRPMERADIAALAPVVLHAAQAGDATAQQIVASGADELALIVQAVSLRLFACARVPVVFAGGLSQNRYYREKLSEALARRVTNAQLQTARYSPVVGALWLAFKGQGLSPPPSTLAAASQLAPVE